MGYTRNTGQLSYLITYDGSGNITVPASFTQTTVTSSMLKADSAGKLVAAVAGTDFVAPAGLSAYVPTTRTITINGTSYDLSADRSWSIVSGVSSFNTRTGAITLTDTDVTGALGYTPVTNARTLTINGTTYDLSANRSWTIVAGLSSFNTRTGDITLLDTDVTGALGYTPVTNARTITINGTTYDLSANRTWVVDASSVTTRVIQKFTATASQANFTITGGYTVGMVDVFLNGIKLDNATEFTASDGSVVTLTSAAASGDIVEVYKYGGQFIANNSLRQTTAFTATAGQQVFTVNYSVGFVDVFYNGSKLAASEFTAINGTSISLGTACVVGDIVEVVAYNYTVGAFTGVGGSGTTNYIPKWTASGTLGNSVLYDNGNSISIGTSSSRSVSGYTFLTINGSTKGGYLDLYYAGTHYGSIGVETDGTSILSVGKDIYFGTTVSGSYYERLRITNGGKIGINTNNPLSILDIRGTSLGVSIKDDVSGNFAHLFSESGQSVLGWGARGNSTPLLFGTYATYPGSSWQEVMRLTSTKSLCIGMSISPYSYFSVRASTTTNYGGANVYAQGNDNFIAFTHDNNTGWITTDYASGGTGYTPIAFATGAAERLKILTSGNIEFKGQSTSANLKALWYNTNSETTFYSTEGGGTSKDFVIYSSGSASYGAKLNVQGGGSISLHSYPTDKGYHILFAGGDTISSRYNSGGTGMYLQYNGNGAIYAGPGLTVLYAGSDERIKENINVVESTLHKVLQLIPKTFNYKERRNNNLYYGFIAQEVEEVFPELVKTEAEPTMCNDEVIENQKSIESYALVWASILTKAIQEQQAQIEELKKLIDG